MSAPLSKELALRVGLSARELVGVSPRDLLSLLISIMGEPITDSKIRSLRAKKLRNLVEDKRYTVDDESFEKAFALLKGRGIQKYMNTKPVCDNKDCRHFENSLLVACASNCDEHIDGQFSNCMRYLVYRVSSESIGLIDIREPTVEPKNKDEKLKVRAALISDCALVYATTIGGVASSKIVNAGLIPIKVEAQEGRPVLAREELARVKNVLSEENIPPWLTKVMNKTNTLYTLEGE